MAVRNAAPKGRRAPRRLLWSIVYVLAVLVLFEGLARFSLLLIDTTWGTAVPPQVGQFDPMLGWKLRPGICASSKRTGRKVEYCINSKGLRDDEVPYEKPADWFRIALLGDSRSFGFGVPEEQHFARILEGYFERLDVINMGVDGYGVDQMLLVLREEAFKYQPDMVMAYVPHYREYRHMKTSVWGVAKPRFVFAADGSGELVLENQPVRNHDTFYAKLLAADRTLSRYSKLYKILRDLAVYLGEHAVVHKEEQSVGQVQQASSQDARLAKQSRNQELEVHRLAEAIVLEMARECRQRGVEFVLVTAIQRLYEHMQQAEVPVVNISIPLDSRAYPLPGKLGHFNEAGNGAFAWELARFLRNNHLVPPGHVPQRPAFNYPSFEYVEEHDNRAPMRDTERMDHAS